MVVVLEVSVQLVAWAACHPKKRIRLHGYRTGHCIGTAHRRACVPSIAVDSAEAQRAERHNTENAEQRTVLLQIGWMVTACDVALCNVLCVTGTRQGTVAVVRGRAARYAIMSRCGSRWMSAMFQEWRLSGQRLSLCAISALRCDRSSWAAHWCIGSRADGVRLRTCTERRDAAHSHSATEDRNYHRNPPAT